MTSWSPTGLLTALSTAVVAVVSPQPASAFQFHGHDVLGTSLDFVVAGTSRARAIDAAAAAREEIGRLEAVLSGWRPGSELARLNAATGPFAASATLFDVISACEGWRSATGGAFSARLAEVEALWRSAAREGREPEAQALAGAALRADAAVVELDPVARTILRPEGVRFAVDALAKGFIIDRALQAARAAAPEARGMLIDIGGDLRCWGQDAHGAWSVGVAGAGEPDNLAPETALALRDRAVATSGPGARDRLIGGRSFSHLLSPASGQAVGSTVTVVGPTAAEADAMATALAAMEPDDALAFAEARPDFEARVLGAGGAAGHTSGWSGLLHRTAAAKAPARPAPAAAAGAWPPGFGVKVDLTILPLPTREFWPYVVVWVSDPEGRLVRTVSVWGDNMQYVGENYVWWRAFQKKFKPVDAIRLTRASRPTGAYSVVWDGRDDAGALVPPGRYTINVEYTREEGPKARQAMTLDIAGAKPAAAAAGRQEELGPSAARYGKVR